MFLNNFPIPRFEPLSECLPHLFNSIQARADVLVIYELLHRISPMAGSVITHEKCGLKSVGSQNGQSMLLQLFLAYTRAHVCQFLLN